MKLFRTPTLRSVRSVLLVLALGGVLAVGLPQAVAAQDDETPTLYSHDDSKNIDVGASRSGIRELHGMSGFMNGTYGYDILVADPLSRRLHRHTTWSAENVGVEFGEEFGLYDVSEEVTTPVGIWTDGSTVWFADSRYPTATARIVALDWGDRSRIDGSSFELHGNNSHPQGIWSDETTLWVVDSADTYVYAYTLSSGARDETKEFNLHSTLNLNPRGLWSDGTTIWVIEDSADTSVNDSAVAYTLADGSRDAANDFDLTGDHEDPTGAWSDGTTMWIADKTDLTLYAYHMTGTRAGGA